MENFKMRLTLRDEVRQVDITCHRDSDIFEVMREIRGLLIAWGYHEATVLEGCEYIVEEYKED